MFISVWPDGHIMCAAGGISDYKTDKSAHDNGVRNHNRFEQCHSISLDLAFVLVFL